MVWLFYFFFSTKLTGLDVRNFQDMFETEMFINPAIGARFSLELPHRLCGTSAEAANISLIHFERKLEKHVFIFLRWSIGKYLPVCACSVGEFSV